MTTTTSAVLGLFPAPGEVGGIERSGLEAWRAVTEKCGGQNHLIAYGRRDHGSGAEVAGHVHRTHSQFMSVLMAASRRWHVNLVLIWHLGMLKLLPFLRTGGARTVLFLHGIEAWRETTPGVRKLLQRVDLFLSNSDFTWERFLAFHPELRGARHCTVPLGLGEPAEPRAIAPPAEPPTALMLGRVARSEAYKGHAAVIGVWNRVNEHIPGARLQIVGPCEITAELMALAQRHGVAGLIGIAGAVPEGEKQRAIEQSRCMALPSRAEGFGLAYLESMRLGRPCLVSNVDAGREVIDAEGSNTAGLAVDPENPDALAAALVRLMTPGEEWERWSAASRLRYETRYTSAHFRARLMAAMQELT